MANPLSSMLDELMGRHRNALPSENKRETRWDDEEVCPYFIAGYCPHELFTNTKADLGLCDKIHDEKLREQYRKSSRFEKTNLEDDFLAYLQKIDSDMHKKINRNKQRLDLTQPGGQVSDMNKDRVEERVTQLSEKITALLSQAEQLGAIGKVDEAQSVIAMMEDLKEERERCRKTVDMPAGELKVMEVCDTCGCFLILGDSQHRLDEHLLGKQHTGFAKIKATIEELLKKKDEKRKQRDEEMRKLREERDKEERAKRNGSRGDRDKDKKRSRHSHESSRDRDKDRHTYRKSSRRSRSRSKDDKKRSSHHSSSSKSTDKHSKHSSKHSSDSSRRSGESSRHKHKEKEKDSPEKKTAKNEQTTSTDGSTMAMKVDNQQVNGIGSETEVKFSPTAANGDVEPVTDEGPATHSPKLKYVREDSPGSKEDSPRSKDSSPAAMEDEETTIEGETC